MVLRKVFELLAVRLDGATVAARELEVQIGDQSAADAVLVERLEDGVQDLLAALAEARRAVTKAVGPRDRTATLEVAGAELATAHERVLEATRRLDLLLAHETIVDLLELGTSRGGGWLPWAEEVRGALDGCRGPLHDVHRSLLECWQEIAERGPGSVSVQATNIGQQVTVPSELAYEEVP